MEIRDAVDALILFGDGRRHGESDLFVRQLDRQLELLRRVHRVEGERALGLSQRRREIAEVGECEAHVVMSFGKVGIGLDGAGESVARVGVLLQIDENQPDTVPGHGMLGGRAENLAIRFQRELGVLPPEQTQRKVQPRFNRWRRRLQRATERIDRALGVVLVPEQHAKIVVRERIARVDLQRALVALLGFSVSPFQLQRDAAAVPCLGGR